MDFLLLTTPTQHAAVDPAVERNPRRLRQWLFDLPIMNVAETVRRLDERIRPFNEMPLAPEERLKLLEVLFEAFDEILFSYDDLRLSMLPVTPEERRQLAQDIMWLYLQLAAGYKIIVLAHFDSGGREVRDGTLATALFRAMELIAHALLYAFRAHETPPPLTYLEFYQLYRYARARDLHRQRLRQIRGYGGTPTVERLFKQVLLLCIADPYRMSAQAVFENYLLLDGVCETARIEPLDACSPTEPLFRFLFDEDAPPVHCALVGETPDGAEGGVLRVAETAARLRAQAGDAPPHDAHLMEALAERLGMPRERREPRQQDDRAIHLCQGAAALRHFLEHPGDIERASATEVEETDGITVMDLDADDAETPRLAPCRVRNLSARGYLLECDPASLPEDPLRDGLTGVVDPLRDADDTPIHAGLVRWQKPAGNGRIHLGVEVVPGRPRPIRIHPLNGRLETADGFHFAVDKAAGRPARLLVPAALREADDRFRVQIAGQAYTIAMRRCLIATEHWLLITFSLEP